MKPKGVPHYDVVILGAGLAGVTLARQLLMNSSKRILLLEKLPKIPSPRQKVGEATVQLSGYYLSKVLDLEEHLLREHFMKYNLRFYWKTPGRRNNSYEDYSQSYIRNLSNIATYQLNRNKLEGEILRLNRKCPNFSFRPSVSGLEVHLAEADAPHHLRFDAKGRKTEIQADWIVDTTGRAKFLARRLRLVKSSPIRHGAVFFWVGGLLNIEKLTGLSHLQNLAHKNRRMTGHLPVWLGTNHFCGEGFWFWTIPLQGITSLGLVYDREKVAEDQVNTPVKVIEWICREFPLFARDLPKRKIVDQAMFRDFAYDCQQTISAERWALSGEAGRFTDPLYSPGGDLITLYNTLITDAILTEDRNSLALKSRLYGLLMRAFYEAYVPSYTVGYQVLGDQECFSMKYSWELTIYFTFYVFPFINQVFTDPSFALPYLELFSKLGAMNRNLQDFIAGYYCWKKKKGRPVEPHEPRFFDFMSFEPLKKAEGLFYQTGLSVPETLSILRQNMPNVEGFARFIAAYIYSVVLGDEGLTANKELIETINIQDLRFDPEAMREECSGLKMTKEAEFAKTGSDFIMEFRKPASRIASEEPPQDNGSTRFSAGAKSEGCAPEPAASGRKTPARPSVGND